MPTYARLQNNIVTDVRDSSPVGCYTDDIVAEFIVIPSHIKQGWKWDGATYIAPMVLTTPPPYNPLTEYAQETEPVLNEQQWVILPLPQEQQNINLEHQRVHKRSSIKAERDKRKFNGVFVSGKWIHTDPDSRTQWLGMVMMGASLPIIEWTTMDGSTINTSPALALAVFQSTAALDSTLFAFAKSLIALVDSSNNPNEVNTTSGWPLTYGE